jgi:CheY-like chemotaxis protein
MKTVRILIVEDEPLVAMYLELLVTEVVTATVAVEASVAAAKKDLHGALDFAFLDVDVTNGKTFEVAQILERKNVPFASFLLSCAACPSFRSLFIRLRLSASCRLS